MVFFNINEKILKNCIDMIYGKEIEISSKLKNRMIWLLKKLGITWEEHSPDDCSPQQPKEESRQQPEKCRMSVQPEQGR